MKNPAGIVRRNSDELDAPSLEYAIQKYEDALRIKPDGPFGPAQALEKAKALYAQVVQQRREGMQARDRNFCEKALETAREHHYQEAVRYSCPLANDDPAYSCGGDEAVHMCEQMSELAKLDTPSAEGPTEINGVRAMDQARAAFEKNDFVKARALLAKAPGEQKSFADEYLDKISRYQGFMAQAEEFDKAAAYEQARMAYASAADIKSDGPGNPRAQALLMQLEEGIEEFYAGD